MLDARRLMMLREVLRSGSITGAAARLHFTPSAVSQQLQGLERQLGVTLLERSPRSVRLTRAGEVLAEHATRVVLELDAAERAVRAICALESGTLRMGFLASAGIALIPGVLRRLDDRYPGLDIHLFELEPEFAIPALRSGDLDIAVITQYGGLPAADTSMLTTTLLIEEPLLVAAPAGRFERCGEASELGRYRDEVWISWQPQDGFQALTDIACREAGFVPKIRCRADNPTLIQELVASGFGLSFVPESAASADPRIDYHPIDTTLQLRRQVIALTRSQDGSAAVAAAITAFRQVSRDCKTNGLRREER